MGTLADVLKDLTVVDCGVGMAPALVSKFLTELGATVIRVEPRGGDPGVEAYPAYGVWRAGHQASTQPLAAELAKADICILGGEDFPGVTAPRDAAAFSKANPRLIVLEITGYPPVDSHPVSRPATEILVQARSGLAYEHYTDRPHRLGFDACTYGAVMQALTGLFAALFEREQSGKGQVVSTSLYEGALHYALSFWCQPEFPTFQTNFVMPKNPYPLVFQCADGGYIHLGMGSANSKYLLYKVLGIDDPTVKEGDSGVPGPTKDLKNFFGDIDLLAGKVITWTADDLQAALDAAGVPAEKILKPGACWDDPQIELNRIVVSTPGGGRQVGNPVAFEASGDGAPGRWPVSDKPLAGVKIVDFGAYVAGPFASSMLADMGADVIKVEQVNGDPSRGMYHTYQASNRGKRNIGLDIKAPATEAIKQALVAAADVVTNNFRSGVSVRLGLDSESLRKARPELIVLESPAYGVAGPKATKAGFDPTVQAISGHEHRAGGAGNAPLWNRGFMADFTGGQLGAVALVLALYHRAHTGQGATMSMPLVNGGVFLLSELIQRADGSWAGAPELDAGQTGFTPDEALYEAKDEWVAIVVRSEDQAKALAGVLGLSGLSTAYRSWGDAERAQIAGAVQGLGAVDLVQAYEAAGGWAEVCRKDGKSAFLDDPGLRALGIVADTQQPVLGRVLNTGPLVRFSRSRRRVETGAPNMGVHTREVLAELGYDHAAIDDLIKQGVAAAPAEAPEPAAA